MYELMERLFPLHRSQTGEGNRKTFEILSEVSPFSIHETSSGAAALDWTIPREWKIDDASISFKGERIVDYQESNLHVLNGSQPLDRRLNFQELRSHLFQHDQLPEAIPYRTAFFKDQWGFCVTQAQWNLLEQLDGPFEVRIDSCEFDGSLTWAQIDTNPQAEKSFLIWAHCCHPSLANDNLSGMVVATFLGNELKSRTTEYNYQIVLAPATIGAINWIARNDLTNHVGGLVLSLLGDGSEFRYKRTPTGISLTDRAFDYLAKVGDCPVQILEFDPFGYDERQFGSPASELHAGRLTRALPGQFDEYHSSFDNLDFVQPSFLAESYHLILEALEIIDNNQIMVNTGGKSEPFLQPYDLYQAYGEEKNSVINSKAVMYLLNMSNGKNDLIDIGLKSGLAFNDILVAAEALKRNGLVRQMGRAS